MPIWKRCPKCRVSNLGLLGELEIGVLELVLHAGEALQLPAEGEGLVDGIALREADPRRRRQRPVRVDPPQRVEQRVRVTLRLTNQLKLPTTFSLKF